LLLTSVSRVTFIVCLLTLLVCLSLSVSFNIYIVYQKHKERSATPLAPHSTKATKNSQTENVGDVTELNDVALSNYESLTPRVEPTAEHIVYEQLENVNTYENPSQFGLLKKK